LRTLQFSIPVLSSKLMPDLVVHFFIRGSQHLPHALPLSSHMDIYTSSVRVTGSRATL
jgi:hypothetical protein